MSPDRTVIFKAGSLCDLELSVPLNPPYTPMPGGRRKVDGRMSPGRYVPSATQTSVNEFWDKSASVKLG